MNVLFVCHRFPFPPTRGGKIRPFNIIRHLAMHHRVTVASLVRSADEAREAEGIAPYCDSYEMARVRPVVQVARMVRRLPGATPSSMGFFYSAHLERLVHKLLASQPFDLLFVHCSSVAQYVDRVQGIPKILDFGDMDSQKWLQFAGYQRFPWSLGYRLEGRKLLAAERRLAARFDMCTATTRAEWETLVGYGVDVPTDWFPNGVDSSYFTPAKTDYDPDMLSFVGRMDYYPNQECMFDYCAHVLPEIRRRRPLVKLQIVGANPSRAVRRLARVPGVTVTGSVPDVRPHLHRSALTVAPLNIARGTQNKILESMAAGVPVVASDVAAGGVDAEPEAHFLVARTPAEHAAAVLRLLEDPSERRRLALAGRMRVLANHSWERSMLRLDEIVTRCLARRAPNAGAADRGEVA